jgi:hypothetical protein
MIAEVPDPRCAGACASGHAEIYARVRQKLMDRLNSPQSEVRSLMRDLIVDHLATRSEVANCETSVIFSALRQPRLPRYRLR